MSAVFVLNDRIRQWWTRWRYYLSAVLIIVPFAYTPEYIRDQATFAGENEGLHSYGPVELGPWTVHLYDAPFLKPFSQGPAGSAKSIFIEPCPSCASQIRAIFVRIGKPRSARTFGAVAGGNAYRAAALLLIPPRATPDDALWLSAEGWDGSVYQASVPLAEATPSVADWLKKQGGKNETQADTH